MIQKKCLACGKVFFAKRNRDKYCCLKPGQRIDRRILLVEKEFNMPFSKILQEFCEEDYMGKRASLQDIANILNLCVETISAYVKKAKIKLPDISSINYSGHNCFVPTPTEDYCWCRYNITLEQYLKRAASCWMTVEEMAKDLNTKKSLLINYAFSHHICLGLYVKCKEERGKLRVGRWAYNRDW